MSDLNRLGLQRMARHIAVISEYIREVHNDMGLKIELAEVLEHLRKAEAQILEVAGK